MLAGPLYAKADKALLSRCRWIKKGVMVYKNYATDICITDDGEYVIADPPVPEALERPLALVVFRGALPPDDREYD
ncbi:MAG: secretion system protein, partial [Thermoproteus sp.]|nr:secretion system protein [Thermoproteus sp.]